jgi:hypothetical protein
MLIDDGGSTYVPPPPPPPKIKPPPPKQVEQLQGQVKAAQDELDKDKKHLAGLESDLQYMIDNPPMSVEDSLSTSGAEQNLQEDIDAAREEVKADQTALDTANTNLAAATDVQNAADTYEPTAPEVTVQTDATKALDPVLTAAENSQKEHQGLVDADQAALDATNKKLAQEANSNDAGRAAEMRLQRLEQKKAEQEQKLRDDQHKLDADNAKIAGINVVRYSAQAKADQATALADLKTLQDAGIVDDKGQLKIDYDKLTPEQRAAYDKLGAEATKVAADLAELDKNYAQLQQYCSDTGKYGTIGRDALKAVNDALRPVNLKLQTPDRLDPQVAATNVKTTTDAATDANAAWNAAAAVSNYDAATSELADLKAKKPANLAELLPAAEQKVAKAQAARDQAVSYLQKLELTDTVAADDAAVTKAQANYKADPSAANWTALDNAQKKAALDKERLQLAQSTFMAGTAEVVSTRKMDTVVADQTKLAGLDRQLAVYGPYTDQAAHDAKVDLRNQVKTTLENDTATAEPSQIVTDNLAAVANKSSADLTTELAEDAVGQVTTQPTDTGPIQLVSYDSSAAAKNAAALKDAKLAQDIAQYQLSVTDFRLTLPDNLLRPDDEAEKGMLDQRWNDYFSKVNARLTDPVIANQLQNLDPGQKVDTKTALDELTQDQKVEHQILGDRSLLEKGWDGITGDDPETQAYVDGKVTDLKNLESRKGSMSAADFNSEYADIMGNVSTRFGSLTEHQIDVSNDWHIAQTVVKQVVVATVAIGVSAATAGAGAAPMTALLVGGGAGFLTSQGITTAQNYSTASSGGDVTHNSEISLASALSNNFGYSSNFSWDEMGRAGVDAGVDAVFSVGQVGGVKAGMTIAAKVAARPAIKAMTQSALMSARFGGRSISAMSGMAANGTVTGIAQITNTTGKSIYEVSQGNITGDQAMDQIGGSVKAAGFNLLAGTVVGGLSPLAPTNIVGQSSFNLASSAAMTYGYDLVTGTPISSTDTLSVFLNAISATAINSISKRTATDLRQGDARAVTQRLAEQNGDATQPLRYQRPFGGRGDRRQTRALGQLLDSAGYQPGVRKAVGDHLQTLKRPAGRLALGQVKSLTDAEHAQIVGLIGKLPSRHGDAFGAQLLLDLAALPATERSTLLANAGALSSKTGLRAITRMLNSSSDVSSAGTNARQVEFLLWLQPQQRGAAVNAMNVAMGLQRQGSLSPTDLATQNNAVDQLVGLAQTSTMPRTLTDFRSGTTSAINPVINGMPLAGVRQTGADVNSNYDAAGEGFATIIKERINELKEAQKQDKKATVAPVRVVIETGATAFDTGTTVVPSAYGPVGAATITRALQEISAKTGVPIEVTQITNDSSIPVLQAANEAMGAKNVTIEQVASKKKAGAWINGQAPDLYLSIGRSNANGVAPRTLMTQANQRPGTMTFAIGDGTRAGGQGILPLADHSLAAWNVNLGAEAFTAKVLDKLELLPKLHTPGQVRAAYNAVSNEGAIRDDARFVAGTQRDTISIDAHVGASNLLRRALDEDAPATWADALVAKTGTPTRTSGATLDQYGKWLEAAAPGGMRDRMKLRAYDLFFRASPGEKALGLLTAVGATVATGAMLTGAVSPVTAAALAVAGTTPRQIQIIKMTGLKRFRQMGVLKAGTDTASQFKDRRRSAKSDFIRFATYPVTGSSVFYDLVNGQTFLGGAHGLAANLHGAADIALLGAVGVLNWVYGSKLAGASVRADGKYYATTLWEPGLAKGRAMDYGAYGSFSSGSILLVGATILRNQVDFNSVGATLNTTSMLVRAAGNIGQTGGVWTERLNPRFIEKHQKGYAAFDWAITTAQSTAVIGSAAAPVILALL